MPTNKSGPVSSSRFESFVTIGTSVDVMVNGNSVRGVILKSEKDNVSEIAISMSKAKISSSLIGKRVNVFFSKASQSHSFDGEVTMVQNEMTAYVLTVVRKNKLSAVQRRGYFRLNIRTNVRIRFIESWTVKKIDEIEPPANEEEEKELFVPAFTVDLSGGGAKIRMAGDLRRYEADRLLLILFEIGDSVIPTLCKVIRVIPYDDERIGVSEWVDYCVQFVDISEKNRNELIQFVFEQQRLQMGRIIQN